MDQKELHERIERHAADAAGLIDRAGRFDQEALDEAVTDVLCQIAASDTGTRADIDDDIGEAEEIAATINNQGQNCQVAALLALGLRHDEILEIERDQASPAPDRECAGEPWSGAPARRNA